MRTIRGFAAKPRRRPASRGGSPAISWRDRRGTRDDPQRRPGVLVARTCGGNSNDADNSRFRSETSGPRAASAPRPPKALRCSRGGTRGRPWRRRVGLGAGTRDADAVDGRIGVDVSPGRSLPSDAIRTRPDPPPTRTAWRFRSGAAMAGRRRDVSRGGHEHPPRARPGASNPAWRLRVHRLDRPSGRPGRGGVAAAARSRGKAPEREAVGASRSTGDLTARPPATPVAWGARQSRNARPPPKPGIRSPGHPAAPRPGPGPRRPGGGRGRTPPSRDPRRGRDAPAANRVAAARRDHRDVRPGDGFDPDRDRRLRARPAASRPASLDRGRDPRPRRSGSRGVDRAGSLGSRRTRGAPPDGFAARPPTGIAARSLRPRRARPARPGTGPPTACRASRFATPGRARPGRDRARTPRSHGGRRRTGRRGPVARRRAARGSGRETPRRPRPHATARARCGRGRESSSPRDAVPVARRDRPPTAGRRAGRTPVA